MLWNGPIDVEVLLLNKDFKHYNLRDLTLSQL